MLNVKVNINYFYELIEIRIISKEKLGVVSIMINELHKKCISLSMLS